MRARLEFLACVLTSLGLAAPSAAELFYLRTSCTGEPAPCYTTVNALNSAVVPRTATNPLVVDIGPGDFQAGAPLGETCGSGTGYISYRGAGRERTRIVANPGGLFEAAVLVNGCTKLGFDDMTFVGRRYGVIWFSNGSSVWSGVDVEAGKPSDNNVGWQEEWCVAGNGGEHYLFNTRFRVFAQATNNVGYAAPCAKNWLYGSEIDVIGQAGLSGNVHFAAAVASGQGEIQAFGSLIRARSEQGTGATYNGADPGTGVAAVRVGKDVVGGDVGGGTFHAHGSNLAANAGTTTGQNATTLDVRSGATNVHTFETSFVATPGSGGVARRVASADGLVPHLQAPFLWHAGAAPPVAESVEGLDLYVETDCEASGNCNGGGAEAHLMVYNPANCGSGNPWFDSVTGRCRNVTP